MSPLRSRPLPCVFFTLTFCAGTTTAFAQIATDGSLGIAQKLSGPNYQITSDLGKIYGKNLFHSFSEFNLAKGQSATFSGPASIANILSRVTGGNPSTINGSLNSTIGGANFFFINPSGVIFGPNAQVNVGGSFVATTADLLHLKDGGNFAAQNPALTVLTSAPPTSFGFLNARPAPIVLNGSQLAVAPGKTFSLVGGNVTLNDATIQAAGGRVNIGSVGSSGEVALNSDGLTLTSFNKLGTIAMNASTIDVGDDSFNPVSNRGGSVSIVGENLLMDKGSAILAHTTGTTAGGVIDIGLTGLLQLKDSSAIAAVNDGEGKGTDIKVKAKGIRLVGPLSFAPSTIIATRSSQQGQGPSGNISLETQNLEVRSGAYISTNTLGAGQGGNIIIKAQNVTLDGEFSDSFSGIAAQALGRFNGGNGGNISLNVGNLFIADGAEISVSTNGSGTGGNIDIRANTTTLDGRDNPAFTGIIAGTFTQFGGDGGSINLETNSLKIIRGAGIDAETQGEGNGGQIRVKANDIELNRLDSGDETGIIAKTLFTPNGGKGGTITIEAKNLRILNGAEISSNASGSGSSGDISIKANNILINGQSNEASTGILATTNAEQSSSQGGSINIESKNIQVFDGGVIAAYTAGAGNGGSITVKTGTLTVDGHNQSPFTGLSTQAGSRIYKGNAGSITVNAKDVNLLGGGELSSSTFGKGAGGNITVNADNITIDGQYNFSFTGIAAGTFAPEQGGQGGDIKLTAKKLKILSGGSVLADTEGDGDGGNINIVAGSTQIDGKNMMTGIAADSKSAGAGGNGGSISLQTGDLLLVNGGLISAGTLGDGNSGNIAINAGKLTLDRQGADFATAIAAETGGKGQGGSIGIQVDAILILDGAEISANTFGAGKGGDIAIKANDITLDNKNSLGATAITAGTKDPTQGGRGGNIEIQSGRLTVANESLISTSSLGSGLGGSIKIGTGDLTLNKGLITSEARGAGDAGAVRVQASGSVDLSNNSSLAVTSQQSNGGNVVVVAGNSLFVTNSSINAQAANDGGRVQLQAGKLLLVQDGLLSARAGGNGGNVLARGRYVIFDRSNVLASAIRGNGGNINVRALVFLPSTESRIDASSQFGVAGNIVIQSPNTILGGSLIILVSDPLGAESYLPVRCIVRGDENGSSFTIEPLQGTPNQPGDLLRSSSTGLR